MGRAGNLRKKAAMEALGFKRMKNVPTDILVAHGGLVKHAKQWVPTAAADAVRSAIAERTVNVMREAGVDERCIAGAHDWQQWDCGCSFGCESCGDSMECARDNCGARR